MPSTDAQLAAFRRLLVDAHVGGQAKVDALVALVQRTIFVVPWPAGVEGYRTLVNSDGVAALPMFTGRDQLGIAAQRFGWLAPDGSTPSVEIGARAALHHALQQGLSFVVLDIASDHALEIDRKEYEPLLTPAARRDSSGPFAATGKLSSSLIRAVRPTPPPMSPGTKMRPTPAPGTLSAPRMPEEARSATPPPTSVPARELRGPASALSASAAFNPSASAQSFGSGSSVSVSALGSEPSDDLLESLSNVLRDYPEVEWACLVLAARGPTRAVPTIGVRVDSSFRQRVSEIVGRLRSAGDALGAALDVLLLDDAAVMRQARGEGLVFYPWRKR